MSDVSFSKPDIGVPFELMRSPVAIGVQIQLFDEREQRDGARDAMLELLREPAFECGGETMSGFADYSELSESLSTPEGTAFIVHSPTTVIPTIQAMYWIGDRLMVSLSVATVDAENGWSDAVIEHWVEPIVEKVLERVDQAALPSVPA